MRRVFFLCAVIGVGLTPFGLPQSNAAEIVTLANVVDPGPNKRDEPLAAEFSMDKALTFLDSASLTWQKERQCISCHTNFAHLYARPNTKDADDVSKVVRQFAEDLITKRWVEVGPRWDAEVIATAAALAFNDSATTGKLHPLTKQALDRMWTVQREDGGFTWLKCGWPPMESDDHYGATLAAIAVGVAPEAYAKSEAAQKGMAKIREYLKANPGPTLHHRAMVLWASTLNDGLLADAEKKEIVEKLSALQKADGGWGVATMLEWERADKLAQDLESSDGYGTGFVLYVLRRSGVPANDKRIEQGVAWLKSHQRESGRWFTRSLNRDNKHYLTHAGTAFAVMALKEAQ